MSNRPTPIKPGPGQESVWDYPRPPRIEPVTQHIVIVFNGVTLADTTRAYRILETSHPPTYYLPTADIQMQYIRPAQGNSFCEWKGQAVYYTVEVNGRRAEKVAWGYPTPTAPYRDLKDHLGFYAAPFDSVTIAGEQVTPQPGNFYAGWITSNIVGPFKGIPGSWGW